MVASSGWPSFFGSHAEHLLAATCEDISRGPNTTRRAVLRPSPQKRAFPSTALPGCKAQKAGEQRHFCSATSKVSGVASFGI
jgi:hypothetical protein